MKTKMTKMFAMYLITMLLMLSVIAMTTEATGVNASITLTNRNAISITNNSEFTQANGVLKGSGIYSDPYIIENYRINQTEFAVVIVNETVIASASVGISVFNLGYTNITNQTIWIDDVPGIATPNDWWKIDEVGTGGWDDYFINTTTGEITLNGWDLGVNCSVHVWLNHSYVNDVSAISIIDTTAYCVIRNCEVYMANETTTTAGIYIQSSSNIKIYDCDVYSNRVGIRIEASNEINIYENDLNNNGYIAPPSNGGLLHTGIYVISSSFVNVSSNLVTNDKSISIHLYGSNNCVITNNIVLDGVLTGIQVERSINNTISYNYVSGCLNGFYGRGGTINEPMEYNLIIGNTFTNSTEKGIYLINTENNTFYHNNLYNNDVNVITVNYIAYNGGVYTDVWYDDDNDEGNYYDDYNGEDLIEPFGVGDTMQILLDVNATEANVDLYPLMEIFIAPVAEVNAEVESLTTGALLTGIMIAILPAIVIIITIKHVITTMKTVEDKK